MSTVNYLQIVDCEHDTAKRDMNIIRKAIDVATDGHEYIVLVKSSAKKGSTA